jgi:hypothetical protein
LLDECLNHFASSNVATMDFMTIDAFSCHKKCNPICWYYDFELQELLYALKHGEYCVTILNSAIGIVICTSVE